MAKIVKLWAKQTVNNALYHHNGLNTTLVHNLPLNSKVLVWRKSSSWNRPYRLLAVKNKTCCIQFFSGLTSFKNIFIKPYFQPKTTYDIKPDKLETTAKPDKLKITAELDKLKVPAKSDELEVLLPTLEVP